MKVQLLQCTDLALAAFAAKTCTGNKAAEYTQQEDIRLLSNCLDKHHDSIFEHLVYSFEIRGASRALLQELARHRLCSMSVQSTRFALAKMTEDDIDESSRIFGSLIDRAANRGSEEHEALKHLQKMVMQTICEVRRLKCQYPKLPNDVLKYALPDVTTTDITFTVNARELAHIFELRTASAALREFRELCLAIYDAIHFTTQGAHDILFDYCGVNWGDLRKELRE